MKKRCTKCGEKKPLSEFAKSLKNKDGLQYYCKECTKKYRRVHKTKKVEYNKNHHQIHKTKINKRQKKYYQINKTEIIKQKKKYRQSHKVEIAERAKKYAKTDKRKLSHRKQKLKYKFNMTLEQYDKIFENQNGVCAICDGINKSGRRLSVDHNHKTGKIRALLCDHCNHLLGQAKENIIILQSAIDYLKKHKT